MDLKTVPRDENGHLLADYGTEVGTKRYAAVDTSGQALSFTGLDAKQILISCDQGAGTWSVAGTITGFTDDAVVQASTLSLPVVAEAGTTVCTVKAVTGTVDISVVIVR